jgi:uncharacterized protein (TIGR03083 family)
VGRARAADCGVALAALTYLAHLDRAAADFAARLDTGDLDAPVPGCPGWRLTDLAEHLGGVHRWARSAIVDGRPGQETFDAPTERTALAAWFREGAAALADTLRATDPATPCWTFGPKPRLAAFWFRRQAHETVLHACDAAASQGESTTLEPALALDGVDEIVTMFLRRQIRLERIVPPPVSLALEPVEGGRWVVDGDDPAPAATVSGPAEAILLLLWHRVGLDDPRLGVSGSREAADAVLALALTP